MEWLTLNILRLRGRLDGAVFREEGVEWKVLKAQWKSSLGCIVVFYYDVAAAAASGVDEDDLHDDHEFVEHSSVDEIMEWCAGSE